MFSQILRWKHTVLGEKSELELSLLDLRPVVREYLVIKETKNMTYVCVCLGNEVTKTKWEGGRYGEMCPSSLERISKT